MARAKAAALLVTVLLGLAPSVSAEVKAIGRFKDWRVYTEGDGKDMICFAAVDPTDMAPKDVDHGEVTFYVATWKSGAASAQPSLKVGYKLRSDITPTAIIGREKFGMYVSGPEAFFKDDREKAFLAALKKGTELRIEAASVKDARTAYHFSLKGSGDAMDKAKALCR